MTPAPTLQMLSTGQAAALTCDEAEELHQYAMEGETSQDYVLRASSWLMRKFHLSANAGAN